MVYGEASHSGPCLVPYIISKERVWFAHFKDGQALILHMFVTVGGVREVQILSKGFMHL